MRILDRLRLFFRDVFRRARFERDVEEELEAFEQYLLNHSLKRSRQREIILERFLEARPSFVYADFMRLELATRLAYLGEVDRARTLCRRLALGTSGSYEVTRAAELLAHLE